MRQLYKNVAILGSSSVITLLLGLASSKVWALLGGPIALGQLALSLNLMLLGSMVFSFGLNTALVRFGSASLESENDERFALLRNAAWFGQLILCGFVLLIGFVFAKPIAQFQFGSQQQASSVVVIAIAVCFAMTGAMHIGVLNAHQRIGALAKANVWVALVSTCSGWVALAALGVQGVVWGVLVGAISGWFAARLIAQRELAASAVAPFLNFSFPNRQFLKIWPELRELLRFGAPYAISVLVGQAVQLLIPSFILAQMGQESVGYFRAAATISMVYLGLLTNSMTQDYFPRLSGIINDRSQLKVLVNRQHELTLVLAVPIIFVILWLTPVLVPTLYSKQFLPAQAVLEWQLIGDILKFSSWVLAFVILVGAGSTWFFVTELLAGTVSLFAYRWGFGLGLPGLGIAFLITYVVYWGIVATLVWRKFGFVLSASNLIWLSLALAAGLSLQALPFIGVEKWRFWIAGFYSLMFSGLSALAFTRGWRTSAVTS